MNRINRLMPSIKTSASLILALIACSVAKSETAVPTTPLSELNAQISELKSKLASLEAERAKLVPPSDAVPQRTNLVIQIGATMKSGETKPVSNVQVYISKKSLLSTFPDGSRDPDGKRADITTVWATILAKYGPSLYANSQIPETISDTLQSTSSYQGTTDFGGKVSFDAVEPGTYYVICGTRLGGGAVYQKCIVVAGKTITVALDNDSIIEAI